MSETTFRPTPATSAIDAAPWRRSCSRIGGRPASRTSARNWRVTTSRCLPVPFLDRAQAVVFEARAEH